MLFKGTYAFLSNFAECYIGYEGLYFPSVEHAYQAAKTDDPRIRNKILQFKNPGQAKRFGQSLILPDDWEKKKLRVMETLVRKKFNRFPYKRLLLDTDNIPIVEDNTWGDTFWGVCNGVGDNHLGKIIMKIREEIKRNDDFEEY